MFNICREIHFKTIERELQGVLKYSNAAIEVDNFYFFSLLLLILGIRKMKTSKKAKINEY